ncbi:ATP-dependent RNA helicase HrpA [Paraconexibacter antarcticus]|uniref:ATP-dependent RNA helicase HrpA n=1 Tax=Paraconexibacter antarcticus TaxID=2949664 RepID=A0ABY5DVU8_9ACTN|nr:ATP-dependent RNA helicase HrpA [Paraconexibacter antarcticus]
MPRTISFPPDLPVSGRIDDLAAAIGKHQVVIVAGETGSGKTTQLPKLCLKLGRGIDGTIAHTQPRRIAARSVAQRIAEELATPLGATVGYSVRFENKSSDTTLIRLMTDGLLLAEIQRDRLLSRYDTIIVDEAHERSLNIDFLLGYLRRILPARPDLKVIITSATIDSARFSEHFGDAPVVEVSGRTYPVEVRYRPLGADEHAPEADEDEDPADALQGHSVGDRDQSEAIADAVDELLDEAPGDILVFLSGEREIRDAADTLSGRVPSSVEILPLFARLSTAEQQRIFRRGDSKAGRRVVLATNVAETSLTVPGIKYVIDAGTARISRYSTRLKVQRLPIEPISQASARQRAGRCGRTSDGICIRLYSEQDFASRPEYTDPEILRTSLAAVILQMALLGLGAIEDYPFVDPPDRRQIRDGVMLLQELGAIAPGAAEISVPRLTKDGRRLAQLPVDPRLARMVLEADRLSCAEEVIVIVAALSIQDPRIRPSDERGRADQLHARFKDEHSDFLTLLNLWRYLEQQQEDLSRSKFRKRCREEFLHHLRIREWQDLVARLQQATRTTRVTLNQQPGTPEQIHRALLSGLLSHVGVRDAKRRDYLGARGSHFRIFPGSALGRATPEWVMAAELVETSQLFARTAAKIDPRWIEPLAADLLKRTYSEPRWDLRKAAAVATERATLYGLPVVAGRTVTYAPIDPELAREFFIQHALVEGDWETRHEFVAENREVVDQALALEDRLRRRGLLAGDHVRAAFFEERIPEGVVSGAHFDRWWREERRRRPGLLTYSRELLIDPAARADLDPKGFPAAWRQGNRLLRLSYRFDPGAADDGITVHVPLAEIADVDADEFEWLVPGLRRELVVALLRGLPKDIRRRLLPIPETAQSVLAAVRPRRERLADALARELERQKGVRVEAHQLSRAGLEPHLRVAFQVETADRTIVARGPDLDVLRAQVRPTLRQELVAQTPELQATGLTGWSIGTLPRELRLPGEGVTVYPSLVDEGATVGVTVLDSRDAQARAMAAGTRRLLLLNCPSPTRRVRGGLDLRAQLVLAEPVLGGIDAVLQDAVLAAVDFGVTEAGGPAWDPETFATLRRHVAGHLEETTERVVTQVVEILELRAQIIAAVAPLVAEAHAPARADIQQHLARLVHRGFIVTAGAARLADLKRFVAGILQRVERLRSAAPGPDLQSMAVAQAVETEAAAVRAAWPPGRALPPDLLELPWLLEELRVSLFAQGLGTKVAVSPKKVRRRIAELAA